MAERVSDETLRLHAEREDPRAVAKTLALMARELLLARPVIAAARSGGIRCQCEWIGLDRVSVCPLCNALRRYDEGSDG